MLDTQFIPAGDPASRCLMIVLHGLGDSMDGYSWWPAAMRLPWSETKTYLSPGAMF